jgi:hypothetical protein
MKKVLSISLILIGLVSCSTQETEETSVKIRDFNYQEIENGDIILKRGKGYVSSTIVNFLKEDVPLSHCGIIIKNQDSCFIIHSVAIEVSGHDGLQTTSISAFLDDSYQESVYVVRPKAPDSLRQAYALKAQELLDQKVPFDYDFNLNDQEKLYCSEMIYVLFDETSQNTCFLKKKFNDKEVILFQSFLDTTHFEMIKKY